MLKYRNTIQPCLDIVTQGGTHSFRSDAFLFGQASHVTPMAVQHKLFPPLSDKLIEELEAMLGLKLPQDLKDFYAETNGLNLFVKTLCIFGFREEGVRRETLQPFDIVAANKNWQRSDFPSGWTVIGGYADGNDQLCLDAKSGTVYRIRYYYDRPLTVWSSLAECLEKESNRLAGLYKEANGQFPKKSHWRKYLNDDDALYDETFGNYICTVCGYDGLTEPPYSKGFIDSGYASYEGCSACGFETGYDDDMDAVGADGNYTNEQMTELYRKKWIEEGMPWRTTNPKPLNWDPKKQLRNIGIIIE